MAHAESVERLKNSRVVADYWWFDLEDIKDLFERMGELDFEGTIRAVPGLDEEGNSDLHLVLFDSEGEYVEAGNFSHPCPPSCG